MASLVDRSRTAEDRRNVIRRSLKQFGENNGFQAGILCDGRLAGVVGHHGIDWQNRSITLAYWLREEYLGKGFTTAACRVLMDHVFVELGLNWVGIACVVENERSRAVPERLGFQHEGVQRQAEWLYDHLVNHTVYAALEREWGRRFLAIPNFRDLTLRQLERSPKPSL